MSMFSQFSFRPLDEVPKPRIHTDSDYNSPTPSTGIDSPAKFDDPYDSDEFLEHHSSRSSLSLSRSWSRPKSRDSIPEEDEENEGQVSSLSVLCPFGSVIRGRRAWGVNPSIFRTPFCSHCEIELAPHQLDGAPSASLQRLPFFPGLSD